MVLVFPKIWLLICKSHLHQSWKNHCNKIIKGKSANHTYLRNQMKCLEDALVATVTISDACNLILSEAHILTWEQNGLVMKCLKNLKYLDTYWTTESLWQCWSDFGCRVAAGLLKCTFEGVLPTTNHLESFNGVLK